MSDDDHERDMEWILALADALRTKRVRIPIEPEPKLFKELFEEILRPSVMDAERMRAALQDNRAAFLLMIHCDQGDKCSPDRTVAVKLVREWLATTEDALGMSPRKKLERVSEAGNPS